MKCPACECHNPDEARFCTRCGTGLPLTCPGCQAVNPPASNFCMKCAHDLRQTIAPPPESYQVRSSRNLNERTLSSRSALEGERKLVTVLFADVADYTALSQKVDLETVHQIMDGCFRILMDEIHWYEGTVDKFAGDSIMALFGAPVAHEDHAQRACHAALAIQRAMKTYGDRVKTEHGADFRMRIGINSGPVIVGSVGYDLRMDYFALGDTTNLASRMQNFAEPGTIVVSENAHRLASGYFEFEPLGQARVKGREEPVKIYKLVSPGQASSRLDVASMKGLTPFVGRQRELELLLDAFERAKPGRGQAISIVGEAGVGKSRLVHEFRKNIASEDVAFLDGRCLAYGAQVAYQPLTDLLKSSFGVRADDDERQTREKAGLGLQRLGVSEPRTLAYVLELLSVRDSGIDKIPTTPESRRDRILDALKRIVLKGSELRPLVIAVEDLHWIDRASEEALRQLLGSVAGARVLLIFTYRPEFTPSWGSRSYHSQVTLNRLSNRESLIMAARLLGTEMDRNLEELILEKTEGIPFFIEEFVRSLRDLGLIRKKDHNYCLSESTGDVAIPGTIQDVIMARVDPLPEGAKTILRTGSVIEREFSYELIRRVTGLPEQELLSHLSVLRDAELIYERGIYPKSTYVFRHALTREVVYDLILSSKRKRLHLDVANAIEEVYRRNLREYYEILAGHYVAAGAEEKAVEYWRLAEKKAERTGSFDSAIAYCQKRIASLERLPQTEMIERKILDARVTLGFQCSTVNYLAKAKEAVEPVLGMVLESGDKWRLAQTYTIMGAYSYLSEADFAGAFRYLNDSFKISQEMDDEASQLHALAYLGWASQLDRRLEESLRHFETMLDIGRAQNNAFVCSLATSAIAGLVHDPRGKLDQACALACEALRMADQSLDTYSRATAHLACGLSAYYKGCLEEAEGHLLKGSDYCQRMDLSPWHPGTAFWLGNVYSDMGLHDKAVDYQAEALSLYEKGKFAPWLEVARIALVRARALRQDRDIDMGSVVEWARRNKARFYDSQIASFVGEILLHLGADVLPEAESWIRRAIDIDTESGMRFFLGKDYALLSQFHRMTGDRQRALESLSMAAEILDQCGAEGWVGKTREELAGLREQDRRQ